MRKVNTVKPKPEDMFLRLTLIQVAFALVLGGIFFGAYKLDGEFFDGLRQGFLQLMSVDMDIGDYLPYNIMQDETTEESSTHSANPAPEEKAAVKMEKEQAQSDKKGAGGEDSSLEESKTQDETRVAVFSQLPPAVMPAEGCVSSSYGYRIHPVYGTEGFHSGLDIAADEGSEVLAVFGGEVIETGVGEKSGNYIRLDNGKGVQTLYCHCSEILARKGQRVSAGEKIALVGQTGLATGPHLHLELRVDGELCDPASLFQNCVSAS